MDIREIISIVHSVKDLLLDREKAGDVTVKGKQDFVTKVDLAVQKRLQRILFEKYPMDKSKTLFIGNDSTTDIAGASKAGLDTYYICSNISPKGLPVHQNH